MPNLSPYADPQYFVLLVVTLIPVMLGLYYGKRFRVYETIWTAAFLLLTFGGIKWHQGVMLVAYVVYQLALVMGYDRYRKRYNQTGVFVALVVLSALPLALVKLSPAVHLPKLALLGFLGISYLTFKTVQVIMELRDGTIKEVSPFLFLRFLLFFPTITSGPIDRYRRFQQDDVAVPSRDDYLELVNTGVMRIFQGFVYKYIIGYIFGTLMLPHVAHQVLMHRSAFLGTGLSWPLVAYMYVYSMYLFFDFAGYSLFAVGISNLMGVRTPMNFNAPFKAQNIKDFWNRWHMSLSFWFRDFVFMRFTFFVMKHRLIKNRIRVSQFAYLVNFLIMGFWHGVTWYYIVYGLFHATAIIINDIWLRYKKRHSAQLPHNRWTQALAVVITFNVVCLSFLIFSGELNTLWFKH